MLLFGSRLCHVAMRPGRGDEYSKAVQMVQHTDLKESKMMMMIMMNEVIFEFTLQSQLEF